MWACGFGPGLGLGTSENQGILGCLTGLAGKRVKSISSGQQHAIAITEDGEIWGWGNNMQRQLGEACSNIQLAPSRIEIPTMGRAKAVRVVTGFYETAIFAGRQLMK